MPLLFLIGFGLAFCIVKYLIWPMIKAIILGAHDGWTGTKRNQEEIDHLLGPGKLEFSTPGNLIADDDIDRKVYDLMKRGTKNDRLEAIRIVRNHYGYSLKDAKEYVELLDIEEEYEPASEKDDIDGMEGHDFEYFCADLLRKNGFINVSVTPGSGDQGVDVLATKDSIKYAIQCKSYSSPLGNTPIQEVHAGKAFYNCHVGVVMTNSTFTPGARQLAEATGTLLWDRNRVTQMMNKE